MVGPYGYAHVGLQANEVQFRHSYGVESIHYGWGKTLCAVSNAVNK